MIRRARSGTLWHARSLRARFARGVRRAARARDAEHRRLLLGRTAARARVPASCTRRSAGTARSPRRATALEDHYKRVKVVSDLLGVEHAALRARPSASATLRSIEAMRARVAVAARDARGGGRPGAAPRARAGRLARRARGRRSTRRQASDPAARARRDRARRRAARAAAARRRDLPAAIARAAARAWRRRARSSCTPTARRRRSCGRSSRSPACSARRSRTRCRATCCARSARSRPASSGSAPGSWRTAWRSSACEELDEVGDEPERDGRAARARRATSWRSATRSSRASRSATRSRALANRALFRDRVEHALARRERRAEDAVVLFVDLDDFKGVNDTLGHDAGDRAARRRRRAAAATRRAAATRSRASAATSSRSCSSTCARADEAVHRRRARARADCARRSRVGGDARCTSGVSVGIARGHGGGGAADELLRNADVAMYRAKAARQGALRGLRARDARRRCSTRLELEAEPARARASAASCALAYQPIVDLRDAARARRSRRSLRWHAPARAARCRRRRSSRSPRRRGSSCRSAAGCWREACREAARWQRRRRADGAPSRSA